jgi:hypothetical protein
VLLKLTNYTKLTPWCRVLLAKLTVTQLVNKFPFSYGIQSLVTVITRAWHWSLSSARCIIKQKL